MGCVATEGSSDAWIKEDRREFGFGEISVVTPDPLLLYKMVSVLWAIAFMWLTPA
jgi:hypothetical protein